MNKKVVIIGAGGHAHVIADIIFAMSDEVIAFLDDDENISERNGSVGDYIKYSDSEFVIAIGNPYIREKFASELKVKWYTAIHPTAVVSPSAKIGEGTVVMPNAVINARSVVGKHCIVNTGAIVEHDNIISDFAHISVGAKTGGNVMVCERTWVGIGATIKNGIKVCNDTVIGAGATVVENISDIGTYIGVPVRKLK